MTAAPDIVETAYATIVREFALRPNVEVGSKSKAFGSGALKMNGKIFAMLSSRGAFVVKLPRQRVAELVASNAGRQFDPGHGRLMKEWLELMGDNPESWRALANEALALAQS